jgi:hypothetical protein
MFSGNPELGLVSNGITDQNHTAQIANALYRVAAELNQLNAFRPISRIRWLRRDPGRRIPAWAWTVLVVLILLLWAVVHGSSRRIQL